jgi:2-methylaconitate cis-trans-isomerase PrpF
MILRTIYRFKPNKYGSVLHGRRLTGSFQKDRPKTLEEVPNPLPNVGFYRGGTSKGVFIPSDYLPESPLLWPRILMGLMGSPDPIHKRQLNGMGGGISSLSKVVVVSPSAREDIDCEYTFVQVGVGNEGLDFAGNCGNLSSIAGIFAVDAGICNARIEGDHGRVRSWNTNTNKIIDTVFPIDQQGIPCLDLPQVEVAGVSGKASKISLEFLDPGGAMTGKLLPTGSPVDVLELPGDDLAEVSLVDATNPTVILPQHELRILLSLLPDTRINFEDQETLRILETIRSIGAKSMHLQPAQAQPKIVVVQPAEVSSHEDLVVTALSMGVQHKAIPMTVGLCLGVASSIQNSVVERMLRGRKAHLDRGTVIIRHPSGIVEVGTRWDGGLQSVSVIRSGRRLMRGDVYW